MNNIMERFQIDKHKVLSRTKRMSPPKAILAARARQLDAVFLPEHWITMVNLYGLSMLLTAKDIWPGMIGSVLVVREELTRNEPETVSRLVRATEKATGWMDRNPSESAMITARYLSLESDKTTIKDSVEDKEGLRITPELASGSMSNLEYETRVDKRMVQDIIDNAARLGNIKKSFPSDEILDLRFLHRS